MNPAQYALMGAKDSLIEGLLDIVDQLTDDDVRKVKLEYTSLKSNSQDEFQRLHAQLDAEIDALKSQPLQQESRAAETAPELSVDKNQMSLNMPAPSQTQRRSGPGSPFSMD